MKITKTQFQKQFDNTLALLDQHGEEIIIIDDGKPLFRLSKYCSNISTEELFAPLRGKVKYYEDLTTPTMEEWKEV